MIRFALASAASALLFFQSPGQASLNLESYKLSNGFSVYLNEDPTASNVYCAILVAAGSVDESPEATGMSHYLEHMLFKGTDQIGTTDFSREKIHYDSIIHLYEKLAFIEDQKERDALQKQINQQSQKGAKYGLPNEFSNLMRSLGASELNAFADYDVTFYHNYLSAAQLPQWIRLSADRFVHPVFRSFQSELEVVYEEKNRSDDDYEDAIYDEMQALLFPDQPYGRWSPLGFTRHLKNPSLVEMQAFFDTHYVAKNMTLILSGNFVAEAVKPSISEAFSQLNDALVPETSVRPMEPIAGVREAHISVTPFLLGAMAFHTALQSYPDRVAMDVCEFMLSNESKTGLVDGLELDGRIARIFAEAHEYEYANAFTLYYTPESKRDFEKAESMIRSEISKLKEGSFDQNLLQSAKLNLSKAFQKRMENLEERTFAIAEAHMMKKPWKEYLAYPEELEAVTKEQIISVANKYFGEHYARLISTKGTPPKDNLRQPDLEPVLTKQDKLSEYAQNFGSREVKVEPPLLDLNASNKIDLQGGHEVWVTHNPVNDLFELEIRFKIGALHDKRVTEIADLMNLAGAGDWTNSELKKRLERIGCSYLFSSTPNFFILKLEGLDDKMDSCLTLIKALMSTPTVSEKEQALLLANYSSKREVERTNPFDQGYALIRYAVYGEHSELINRRSLDKIKQSNPDQLSERFISICQSYSTEIYYSGTKSRDELSALLTTHLPLARRPQAEAFKERKTRAVTENTIYLVEDGKARQSQIYFYIPGETFDPSTYGQLQALTEYYGQPLTGVIFQEIREYRSLAYSSFGRFIIPETPGNPTYLIAGLGSQSDKAMEAIEVLNEITDTLVERSSRIENLGNGLIRKIDTEFPGFRDRESKAMELRRKGYTEDPHVSAVDFYRNLSMENLSQFYALHYGGKPKIITIYGSKKHLNMDRIRELGKVIELELDDILVY